MLKPIPISARQASGGPSSGQIVFQFVSRDIPFRSGPSQLGQLAFWAQLAFCASGGAPEFVRLESTSRIVATAGGGLSDVGSGVVVRDDDGWAEADCSADVDDPGDAVGSAELVGRCTAGAGAAEEVGAGAVEGFEHPRAITRTIRSHSSFGIMLFRHLRTT